MIRFYHTADVHFGVENYGKVDPKTGIHTRLLDFRQSLATCIDAAIADDVDFFLLAGDAYKTAHPTPTQQRLLMQELVKLYEARIPVVIVVGNHDHPLSFGKAHALDVFSGLPVEGFHVFSKPEILRLETKSGPVQIVGVPWPNRHNVLAKEIHLYKKSSEITEYLSSQVSKIITQLSSQLDPNLPAVLTGHLTVSSGIFSGSEKCAVYGTDPIFMPSELALPQFDYVALGHLHRYQNLNKGGYPAVVYSGSIDRVDFGERKESKGYCKITIETDCPPKPGEAHQFSTRGSHEFVKLDTRPFIQIEVKLDPQKHQTEQVLAAIEKHDITDAIVKIKYHVPAGKQDTVDLRSITHACKKAMYVVGVIPVHEQIERVRRVSLQVTMGFEELVEKYIDSREDLNDMKKSLLSKAKAVYAEVENQE